MESLPRRINSEASSSAGAADVASRHFREAAIPQQVTLPPAHVPPAGAPPARRERRVVPRDTLAHIRLDLQRRAAANLRHHLLRAIRRFIVLVIADLASFGIMRQVLRAVRDYALVGEAVAQRVGAVMPAGILNGWQYAAALFVALFVTGNYGAGDQRRAVRRLFLAAALATALPLWMTVWTRGLEPVLVQYGVTTVLVWLGLVAERRVIDRIVGWVLPPWRRAAATVFVGPAEECRGAIASPAFAVGGECRPVGFVDVHVPPAADALGHIVDFPTLLHRSGAEVVVVCGYLTDERFREVVDAALAAESQVLSVPRAIEIAGVQPSLVWRRDQPLIELTTPSLKGWQLFLKRIVDLTGAALGLVVTAPLVGLVAVAIKLDSPGPVFFRQDRVGTGGRRFRVWKFRTMRNGASDAAHRELVLKMLNGEEAQAGHAGLDGRPVFKLVNDARVTRVGHWLRRTSLDELPQIFNVLRGEMSLVGPRPPLPYEFEAYDHWQFDRLKVSPGITGLWQVSGRNLLTYRQMCELDVDYVRRWSLWLDFKILLKTIPVVLFNSGRAA